MTAITNETKHLASKSFQPGWYLQLSRGVGIGNWEEICHCEHCDTRGAKIYHQHSFEPCKACGECVKVKTAKFVFLKGLRWPWSPKGFWLLKGECFPGQSPKCQD